jgi:DNA-binding HxlR family transcriptional regulator
MSGQGIDLLGGKWPLCILQTLSTSPAMRFKDLQESIAGISPKVLSKELQDCLFRISPRRLNKFSSGPNPIFF